MNTAASQQKSKKAKGYKNTNALVVDNRVARNRYEFLDIYECGIELVGTEIKSVRNGQMNIRDSYCRVTKQNELYMHNANISIYGFASAYFNHEPLRPRRLLLHKRDIITLREKQERQGLTIVPIKCFFTSRGWLKVEVALARGKQLQDKRQDIKEREQKREIARVLKGADY